MFYNNPCNVLSAGIDNSLVRCRWQKETTANMTFKISCSSIIQTSWIITSSTALSRSSAMAANRKKIKISSWKNITKGGQLKWS